MQLFFRLFFIIMNSISGLFLSQPFNIQINVQHRLPVRSMPCPYEKSNRTPILVVFVVETSNHCLAPAKEDPPFIANHIFDYIIYHGMSLSGTQSLISATVKTDSTNVSAAVMITHQQVSRFLPHRSQQWQPTSPTATLISSLPQALPQFTPLTMSSLPSFKLVLAEARH